MTGISTTARFRSQRSVRARLVQSGAFAAGLGFSLVAGLCVPMTGPAEADVAPSASLMDKLPSFAPIVDHVQAAVVNISVIQKPDDSAEEDGDDNDGQDAQPSPGFPNGSPFDDFLRRFFEQQQQGRHGVHPKVTSLGSGFIIDPAGYIVTNNHVVGDAEKVTVIFQDDSRHAAKIVGKDAKTDLALLKIDAPQPLPWVKFGDSDKAKVGDWVIAVGNPFGLGGTVTKGIISARARPIADSSYVDFLQIDASINRGNSGGPTFDLNGDVIGINSAIYSPNGGSVGIGFAIPSNTAKPVIEQLKKGGHVSRGWLGVQIQEVTPNIASSLGQDADHPTGALISSVNDGSPAARAGLKVGDLVEKFDGKTVDKMRDLPRIVAETPIGKKVDIVVLRAGKLETLQAAIAALDETKVATAHPDATDKQEKEPQLGLYLSSLNPDIRKRLNVGKDVEGVLVQRVKEGSPAGDVGIEAGDVILQVNNRAVTKPEDFAALVKGLKPGDKKSVLLLVNRRGSNRFVAINLADSKD